MFFKFHPTATMYCAMLRLPLSKKAYIFYIDESPMQKSVDTLFSV